MEGYCRCSLGPVNLNRTSFLVFSFTQELSYKALIAGPQVP